MTGFFTFFHFVIFFVVLILWGRSILIAFDIYKRSHQNNSRCYKKPHLSFFGLEAIRSFFMGGHKFNVLNFSSTSGSRHSFREPGWKFSIGWGAAWRSGSRHCRLRPRRHSRSTWNTWRNTKTAAVGRRQRQPLWDFVSASGWAWKLGRR